MDKNFIVRLGPMDREGGHLFSYIVFSDADGCIVYHAATDDQALENITFEFSKEALVCEPALADAAKRFGVDVQPLTRLVSLSLALAAFDHVPGRPLARITEDGLVHHFCSKVAEYERIAASFGDFIFEPLRLRVEGTVQFVTDLYLHKDVQQGEFMSIMMDKADGAALERAGSSAALETSSRIRVSRHLEPVFVRDALHRSHQLECIPVPSRIVAGIEEPVQDMQLAIIISTLNAITHRQRRGDIGRSQFLIRGYRIDCEVTAGIE